MDIQKCQFCQHNNPADSKYCSQCGGCLYLLPCQGCGAVNDVAAVTCYQCSASLRRGAVDTFASPAPVVIVSKLGSVNILSRAADLGTLDTVYPLSPTAEVAKPFFHRPLRLIAGTAVLAVVAVLGYFGYRQHFSIGATQPTAAGGDPRGRAGPASAGVIRGDAASNRPDNTVRPATAASTGAIEAPNPQALVSKGGSAGAVGAPPPAACTESAANLGLCGAAPVQNKAAKVRPDATSGGQGARQDSPAQTSCAGAAAALGLCAPAPTVPAVTHTQRKE